MRCLWASLFLLKLTKKAIFYIIFNILTVIAKKILIIMQNTLFTIGHSTQSVEEFIELLNRHQINCVVDVRSVPYSQYASQFNEREIKLALKNRGIQYIYMGKEFGARRNNKDLYDGDNRLNFSRTMKSEEFITGVDRIKRGMEKGYRIVFMCSEKDPLFCHRCILIGKAFYGYGYPVENILEDGTTISQDQVGALLVDEYFPERNQITLLEWAKSEKNSEEDYIEKAYHMREKEIAYVLGEDGGE